MSVSAIASSGIQAAQQRFLGASERLIEDPSDVDAILETKIAESEVATAVKVLKVQDEIEKSLLDILA